MTDIDNWLWHKIYRQCWLCSKDTEEQTTEAVRVAMERTSLGGRHYEYFPTETRHYNCDRFWPDCDRFWPALLCPISLNIYYRSRHKLQLDHGSVSVYFIIRFGSGIDLSLQYRRISGFLTKFINSQILIFHSDLRLDIWIVRYLNCSESSDSWKRMSDVKCMLNSMYFENKMCELLVIGPGTWPGRHMFIHASAE